MKRVYYDENTGFLCGRYPKDLPIGEGTPYVEVDDEMEQGTYSCEYGRFWAVRDGRLELVEDPEATSTDEYKRMAKESEIASLKAYLSETDYVISKLNELRLEGDDGYEAQLAKYSETLAKRKEARARINELDG